MKESSETRYWLYLLVFSDYLTEKEINKALNLLRESMNLIGSSLITSKKNLEKN